MDEMSMYNAKDVCGEEPTGNDLHLCISSDLFRVF